MKPFTATPAHLSQFFTAKDFTSSFSLGSDEFSVEVKTPSLDGTTKTVWGDWGPMFCCELELEQEIVLTYRCSATGRQARYRVSPPQIELNTPRLAFEREQFPLQMEFCDAARGLRFKAFFNPDGEFDHLVVGTLHPSVCARKLMFRAAERAERVSTPRYAPNSNYSENRASH